MATHGPIEAFDRDTDDWTNYFKRLEQYFAANEVEDADKQRAILLSYCEVPTYRLIRNLVAPAKPTSKTFAQLTKWVNQSLSLFCADLRQISEHCNYENILEDMLRDCLVCGIQDASIQR